MLRLGGVNAGIRLIGGMSGSSTINPIRVGMLLEVIGDNIADAPGSFLSSLPDSSGQSNTPTQTNPSNRATVGSLTINGKKTIAGDGISAFFNIPIAAFTGAYTAIYVISMDITNPSTVWTLFAGKGGGDFRNFHLNFPSFGSWIRNSGAKFTRQQSSLIRYSVDGNTGPAVNEVFFENGAQKAIGVNSSSDSGNLFLFCCDNSGTPSFFFSGNLAYFAIYNRQVTAEEGRSIDAGLGGYYGFAVASQTNPILFIGDSITAGFLATGPNAVETEISDLALIPYVAQAINSGVSGTASGDWLSNGSNFSDAMNIGSLSSFASIMLGTNDSKTSIATSQATYQSNLLNLITGLFASMPNLQKVVLNYPPYIVPPGPSSAWDATSDTLLQSYQTAINNLVNGTTIVHGDTSAYTYFQAHQSQLQDGVHPTNAGYVALGGLWAAAFPL